MTKAQLIQRIAQKTGITMKQANGVIAEFAEAVKDACAEDGGEVKIPDLGTFKCKVTAERQGFNPIAKKKITIPAKRSIVFRPERKLITVID